MSTYKVTKEENGKYTVEKVTDDSATAPVETQANVEGQGENVEGQGQGENVEGQGQGETTDDSATTTETNVEEDQSGEQKVAETQAGGKRRRRKRRSRKSRRKSKKSRRRKSRKSRRRKRRR